MAKTEDKIEVENVNVPGQVTRVNATKFSEMKRAMLAILPTESPGLNQKEIQVAVLEHLDPDIFPEGATSKWWAKTVQLDMEAKLELRRENTKPLRWYLP